jgi:hypothetical protein
MSSRSDRRRLIDKAPLLCCPCLETLHLDESRLILSYSFQKTRQFLLWKNASLCDCHEQVLLDQEQEICHMLVSMAMSRKGKMFVLLWHTPALMAWWLSQQVRTPEAKGYCQHPESLESTSRGVSWVLLTVASSRETVPLLPGSDPVA